MSNESFQSLDAKKKLTPPPSDAPLAKWYAGVRAQPISKLGHADLSRALRQAVHLDVTLPHALERLKKDPIAGEPFPGELLRAALSVAPDVWAERATERRAMLAVITGLRAAPTKPKGVWSDAEWTELQAALQASERTLTHLTTLVVDSGPKEIVGLRVLLPFDRAFAVGSGPNCELCVPNAGLEAVHLKLRMTDAGFEAAAIRGALMVDGENVTLRALHDRSKLTLGKLALHVEVAS
jgi:hypothetical protein